jgi:hypothetical protein
MVPYYADVVGIYDVSTGTFTTEATGLTGVAKFRSAQVVGSKVVMVPYYADVVGIYDVVANRNTKGNIFLNLNYTSGGANNGAQVAYRRVRK